MKMTFNDQHPKVLVHYNENNPLASEMFEYMTDKVPFMDTVGESENYENWVEHTQQHGRFDLYFHLLDNKDTTESWLDLNKTISHTSYYIDTQGTVINPNPEHAHLIVETTPHELWERVKSEYLNRDSPHTLRRSYNQDMEDEEE